MWPQILEQIDKLRHLVPNDSELEPIFMKRRIKALWQGDVPLEIVFWRFAVIYGLILNAATSFVFMALLVNNAGNWLLVPAFLLPVPYNLMIIVAVWRSAGQYEGPRQWVDWSRFATLLLMVVLTAS